MHATGLRVENNCDKVRRSLAVSGGCYINAADGLWIGTGTIWAPNVAIVSQDHGRFDLDDAPPTSGIRIGRDCWLGFGSVIMPNVILGDRTIVGANAVVTKSFPDGNQIIAGAPAAAGRQAAPTGRSARRAGPAAALAHQSSLTASAIWRVAAPRAASQAVNVPETTTAAHSNTSRHHGTSSSMLQ